MIGIIWCKTSHNQGGKCRRHFTDSSPYLIKNFGLLLKLGRLRSLHRRNFILPTPSGQKIYIKISFFPAMLDLVCANFAPQKRHRMAWYYLKWSKLIPVGHNLWFWETNCISRKFWTAMTHWWVILLDEIQNSRFFNNLIKSAEKFHNFQSYPFLELVWVLNCWFKMFMTPA